MNESAAYSNKALGALVAWETDTGVLLPRSLSWPVYAYPAEHAMMPSMTQAGFCFSRHAQMACTSVAKKIHHPHLQALNPLKRGAL